MRRKISMPAHLHIAPSTTEFSSRLDRTSGDQAPAARLTLGVSSLNCTMRTCTNHSAIKTCRAPAARLTLGASSSNCTLRTCTNHSAIKAAGQQGNAGGECEQRGLHCEDSQEPQRTCKDHRQVTQRTRKEDRGGPQRTCKNHRRVQTCLPGQQNKVE
eukprot:1156745-Pelagomonas_calceolata.AAC.4